MTSPLGEAELATLAELAETFVPGDGAARARLAADALTEVADPAQLQQIRLVLRLMESRAANLVLAGRPRPVPRDVAAGSRALPARVGRSRLAQRRSAFGAFRKLMTFLAYADPGDVGAEPALVGLGYRPDDPPVTDRPAAIRPFELPSTTGSRDEPMTLEADAVVVGSGAGGGVVAAALAEAGRSVVVLEAGPFVDEPDDATRRARRLRPALPQPRPPRTWDGAITMLAGAGVGGGTLVNWMTSIDAPADVREEWASTHGLEGVTGAPWSDDLRAIERELGVAESTHIPPKDAIILRGARALGWEAAPTRRNATDCGDCGSCPFGCRRGTKQSGIRVHLARAAAAGARIVPDARVVRVLIEGGRAVGVEAGSSRVVGASSSARATVVVARRRCAADPGDPAGVRPRAPRHRPAPAAASGPGRRRPVLRAGRHVARDDAGRPVARVLEPEPGRNGYVIESAPGHPGLVALALPWEGTEAHADSWRPPGTSRRSSRSRATAGRDGPP